MAVRLTAFVAQADVVSELSHRSTKPPVVSFLRIGEFTNKLQLTFAVFLDIPSLSKEHGCTREINPGNVPGQRAIHWLICKDQSPGSRQRIA